MGEECKKKLSDNHSCLLSRKSQPRRERRSLRNRFSLLLWQGLDARECGSRRETKQLRKQNPPAVVQTIHFAVNDYASTFGEKTGGKKTCNKSTARHLNARQLLGWTTRKNANGTIFSRKKLMIVIIKLYMRRKTISNYDDLIVVCVYTRLRDKESSGRNDRLAKLGNGFRVQFRIEIIIIIIKALFHPKLAHLSPLNFWRVHSGCPLLLLLLPLPPPVLYWLTGTKRIHQRSFQVHTHTNIQREIYRVWQ